MKIVFNTNKYLQIETDRLLLEKLGYGDENFIFNLYSNEEVMRYMQSPMMNDIKEAEKFVEKMNNMYEKENGIRWKMMTKKDVSTPIGTFAIHYYNKSSKRAELGADLLPEYWNKGYISEITSFFIDNLFNILDLNRVEIRCMPENIASINIAKKFNFTYEGRLRDYVFVEDKGFTDEMVFSLLKREI